MDIVLPEPERGGGRRFQGGGTDLQALGWEREGKVDVGRDGKRDGGWKTTASFSQQQKGITEGGAVGSS